MRWYSFGCCFTGFMIIIVLGIISISVVIVVERFYGVRDLGYLLEDVRFSALNLTSSSNSTQLKGEIDFTVRISNPSLGTGIYFKRISMETSYNGIILGDCFIPPFYLGHKTRLTQQLN
ncbi:hypothetical protein O6H91_Y559200 [Diphasiastrum complanatum]|nr:hypothetical protein O6H91_Y559200 [Diphasiastrum complanatum]